MHPAKTVICLFLVGSWACGDGMGPDDLLIQVNGRTERSATVTVNASYRGRVLADSELTWSASPAGAVSLQPNGILSFLEAGQVTLTAESNVGSGVLVIDVAIPPTIVFDLLKDGNRDIYRAALDGRDTVRLTTDFGDDSDPTVAGNSVVFVSFRDGNGELYSTALSGGPPSRLTTNTVNEASPALSPDGAWLAYAKTEAGVPKLWIGASDGSVANRVTDSFGFAGSIETSPSWAPDGERLVFVSTSEGSADLFTYAVAGEQFAPLLPDSALLAEVEPAWSPDGGWVAFATDRIGDTEIYVLEVASGELTRLTNRSGPDGQPAWTADGRLVYVAWTNGRPGLRWLDPALPEVVHEIDVGPGEPEHPASDKN